MNKVIRKSHLVQFLKDNISGVSFLSAEIETVPDMRKTDNPFHGDVLKVQKLNGAVGFDYEAGVNRLATKEGKEERESKPRAWGTLSTDRIFVCHPNPEVATHLRMKVEKSIDPHYVRKSTGQLINSDEIKPFLPVKRKSSTQADLNGEVIERDICLANVKVLHFRSDVYDILPDEPTEPTNVISPESDIVVPAIPELVE